MKNLIIMSTLFWSGMIFAISFIEAPLKFKAPQVTEKIGLGIGQLVFHALNKIEWVLSLIILYSIFKLQPSSIKIISFSIIPILVLSIQTLILFPMLDSRVNEILMGNNIDKSIAHSLFIFLEIIKLFSLIISAIILLKS